MLSFLFVDKERFWREFNDVFVKAERFVLKFIQGSEVFPKTFQVYFFSLWSRNTPG